MQDKMERLIKIAYKKWRQDEARTGQAHPDEEVLACFLDGLLSAKESEEVKLHLLSCEPCAQAFALQAKSETAQEKEVPLELLQWIENLLAQEKFPLLEIFLRFKEKAIEIINTTGDVLVGQELVPAPVLRSRAIKDFKDEVTILKDFQDIRVEIKIENKRVGVFNLSLVVKHKQTQKVIKDLRATLIKDDLELESYLTNSGQVLFEHVLLGKYRIEITSIDSRLASIILDIKI